MPKTISYEKLKTMFENANLPDAIEKYDALGKFLHEKIEKHIQSSNEESKKLKSIQDKLNNK